jgi:hypothetical protein
VDPPPPVVAAKQTLEAQSSRKGVTPPVTADNGRQGYGYETALSSEKSLDMVSGLKKKGTLR